VIDGTPMFEGQALMVGSCGAGAFCHSEGIDAEDRFGAPLGLDYDLQLAGFTTEVDPIEVDRLTRMFNRVYEHRRAIWSSVSSGRMPIGGAVAEQIRDGSLTFYRRIPDEPVPLLDTNEGRESLRNWLACGIPIVERTEPADDMSYVPIGEAVASFEVEPLHPDWPDIYTRMVEPRCNGDACHGIAQEGGLDLRGQAEAYAALIDEPAEGDQDNEACAGLATPEQRLDRCCIGISATRIVPGDPDASFFFHKLAGRDASDMPVCGESMPQGRARLSPASLAAVREWIMMGAPEN
jgi:hypothetical protein